MHNKKADQKLKIGKTGKFREIWICTWCKIFQNHSVKTLKNKIRDGSNILQIKNYLYAVDPIDHDKKKLIIIKIIEQWWEPAMKWEVQVNLQNIHQTKTLRV